MNWEDIIIELARVKPDTFGWLFELVCYPVLKELFGELESGNPLDFQVKGKPVFIEIKSKGFNFHERQIAFIIDEKPQLYVVLLKRYFRPREQKMTKRVICEFQTILGPAIIVEVDLNKFAEHFRIEYETYKRWHGGLDWRDLRDVV